MNIRRGRGRPPDRARPSAAERDIVIAIAAELVLNAGPYTATAVNAALAVTLPQAGFRGITTREGIGLVRMRVLGRHAGRGTRRAPLPRARAGTNEAAVRALRLRRARTVADVLAAMGVAADQAYPPLWRALDAPIRAHAGKGPSEELVALAVDVARLAVHSADLNAARPQLAARTPGAARGVAARLLLGIGFAGRRRVSMLDGPPAKAIELLRTKKSGK